MPFAHLTRSLLRSLLRIEPGEGLRAGLMLLYSVAAVGGVVITGQLAGRDGPGGADPGGAGDGEVPGREIPAGKVGT